MAAGPACAQNDVLLHPSAAVRRQLPCEGSLETKDDRRIGEGKRRAGIGAP
jgi:hypothetical protein